MSHRILTLIPFLNYGQLTKILPKEKMFTTKIVPAIGGTTILPALAKKLGPSDYGLLVEEVIEKIINNEDLNDIKDITDIKAWDTLKQLITQHFNNIPI